MTLKSNHIDDVEMIPVDFDPFAYGEIQLTAPSTEAQKEIWASVQMGPEANCAFNESMSILARGDLNEQVFRESVNDLIARHEALRMTFSTDGDVLSISGDVRIEVPAIDLSKLGHSDREEKLRQLLIEEVEAPFDLEHGPLVRATIIKLEDQLFRILFTAHHIICDGWSMAIVLQDLGKIYRARIKGVLPDLPAPCPFSDYAFEDKKHFDGESGREADQYWLSQYAGDIPALDFPTRQPRPKIRTFNARRVDYALPVDLVKSLKKTGAKAGCTFITVLIAGFKSYLHRVTGQEDLIVGTPAAGQSATGQDRLVGHCVNLLPIRSQVSGETLFSEYLKKVRNLMFDAYEYQRYTFGRLIPKLNIPREPGRIPLVPIIFNIDQKTNEDGFNVEGIESDIFSNHRRYENFEMFLNVTSSSVGDKVVIECTYNSNLFDEEEIQTRLAEFETLLGSICDNPDQHISDLAVMPEHELNKVLNEWNDSFFDYPRDQCVHHIVEKHARITPEKCAAVFEGQQLSYGQLDSQSTLLAIYLSKQGLGAGHFIGLCMERSLSMLVGLLGIVKTGAAYVPLDPEYPQERLDYMIHDAGLTHIVTQSTLKDKIIRDEVKPICIDSDWDSIVQGAASDSKDKIMASQDVEAVAYVIYTSGSTGKPKGVKVPHRALTNFLMSMKHEPGLTVDDVLLAVTTLSFDIAGLELFLPLVAGASVVIASRDTSIDGTALIKCLEENKVTAMQATPSTWRMMLDSGWQGDRHLKILCGGEAFPRDLAKELIPKCREVWNMYGPTETTIWSVINRLVNPDEPILIGRPIGNTKVYILDKNMKPVPIGVSGELYIGGEGVSHGYINKPELTSRQFLSNPFDARSGDSKIYKTGDCCRFHRNGKIEYINRLDNQIKLRGYRIELGEIETQINGYESVNQSIAVCKEVAPGDTRLAAYMIPKAGHIIDEAELRSYMRQSLPTYMIPQHFFQVSEMPLTPAGKIDRKKLAETFEISPDTSRGIYNAPKSVTERTIAAIWENVLKIEKISVTDNFFDMGGHSLLAIQIIAIMKNDLNVVIPIRKFFESPTISELSVLVEKENKTLHTDSPEKKIGKVQDRTFLPLSLQQQRLWFLEQLEGASKAYNLPAAFRLIGNLDKDIFEKSIKYIFRRHDILRTSVHVIDDMAQQIISSDPDQIIMFQDLTAIPEDRREEELQNQLSIEASYTYTLSDPSLFRAILYAFADNEHVFFFMPHHAIWDGWSFDVFLNELKIIYEALIMGEQPILPELPVQYSDFSHWQQTQDKNGTFLDDIAYWQNELGDFLPVLQLPNDFPRPATMVSQGGSEPFQLNKELVDELIHIGRKNDATLFMVVLAAYIILVHRYSKQDEIILGIPISGRNNPEIANLIGFFVNSLPVKFKLSPSMSFSDLLKHVRNQCLDAFNHQDAPFERLVEVLNPERDLSRHPVFQSLFIYQDVKNRDRTMAGLDMVQVNVSREASQTDIDFWVRESGRGMTGGFEYYSAIFKPETIKRMVLHYHEIINAIVENPEKNIRQIYKLSDAEKHRILVELNETKTEYRSDLCIHDLISDQVEKHQHSPAVLFEDTSYSYMELDRLSNQFARILQDEGVVTGGLVGVCVDRSAEMMVALLGILKAGGAYVPLDPDYPKDRLEYMVSDAHVSLLVTQKSLKDSLPETDARVICIDEIWEELSQKSHETLEYGNEAVKPGPNDLAYVIYTSGSTGRPKGVKVHHRAVVNFLSTMGLKPGMNSDDILLAVTTLSFDIHVLELFLPLTVGAKTVIASRDVASDGNQLLETVKKNHVSVMQATPSTWRLLIAAGLTGDQQLKILCGGESFPNDLAEELLKRSSSVWNMYGPTETTVWSTCHEIKNMEGPILIGSPIANTQTYILDQHMEPVPMGVSGELFIGGDGVTCGYMNNPELTARQFIDNPFVQEAGARLYKTGDLVKFHPNGTIEYLNRIDNQVKVRGFRIELGEIETVLAKHEAVKQSVVSVSELGPGDQRLVAYIKIHPGKSLTITDVRKYLQTRLPAYMIPQHVVELDEFPMTPAGKIDRKSIEGPFFTNSSIHVEYIAPRTDMEKTIASVWKELLKIERVGVHDNFFELGGHSLLSVQAVASIKKHTGKTVHLRSILLNSLEQIAMTMESGERRMNDENDHHEKTSSFFGKTLLKKIKKSIKG